MGWFKEVDIALYNAGLENAHIKTETIREIFADLRTEGVAEIDLIEECVARLKERLLEGYELNPDGSVPNDS